MNRNEYPRVLVISPVKFNQETGSGVTMGNLFRGWPPSSIAQIHTENWTEPDTKICQLYYHLPYEKIRQPTSNSTLREILRQSLRYLFRQQMTLFGQFVHIENLLQWSKRFSPDVIYTRPLDRPSLSIWLPFWLSNQLGIPYITRFLDDWPVRHEHDPVMIRRIYWNVIMKRSLKKLLQKAAINVGISEEMCAAFQKRYQAEFIYFHNCVDFASWNPEKTDYSFKNPFKIVYMGTVKADKELQSLIDLKNVILGLSSQGQPIKFTLYGPAAYASTIAEHIEASPVIKYGGFFPAENKFNILKNADLLVLPLNFDQLSTGYLGYSFQTKLPEYMASGTPVLLYGPTDNPNLRYAKRHKWGAVVDKRNQNVLLESLRQLIIDQTLRQHLGQQARKLAFENHNADQIRPRFQQVLFDVADRKSLY